MRTTRHQEQQLGLEMCVSSPGTFFIFLYFTNIYYLQTTTVHYHHHHHHLHLKQDQAHDNHAGQQWPTTTNTGQFWLKQANDSRQKSMTARLVFLSVSFTLMKFYYCPVSGPTTTRPDPEGQQTQAHNCHRQLPQGLENTVAAGV